MKMQEWKIDKLIALALSIYDIAGEGLREVIDSQLAEIAPDETKILRAAFLKAKKQTIQ